MGLVTFICAMCGKEFQSDRPDEEALKEYVDNFGADLVKADPGVVICDTCYKFIDPKNNPEQVAATRRKILGNE